MSNKQFEDVFEVLNKYQFDINLKDNIDFICEICKRILINAHQSPCGCRYCLKCIKEFLGTRERSCPGNNDFCEEYLLKFDRDLNTDHVANMKISKIRVKCPECENVDELRLISSHMDIHRIKCPYLEIGCNINNNKAISINDHLDCEKYNHTVLLMDYLNNMKNEMVSMKENFEDKVGKLQREITDLKALNDYHNQTISALETNCSITKHEMKNMNNLIINLKNELKQFKDSCKKQTTAVTKLENKVSELTLAKEEVKATPKYKEKKPTILVVADSIAPFRWVVDNIAEKRLLARQDESNIVMSPPFYSHHKGYKMRLALYPNGIRDGINDYMSVFFHVIRGENDATLPWPMRLRVELSIVDRLNNQPLTRNMFSFEDNSGNEGSFIRPKDEMNVGCGLTRFVNFKMAFNNNRVIQKNSIILLCSVME